MFLNVIILDSVFKCYNPRGVQFLSAENLPAVVNIICMLHEHVE